MDDKQTQIEAIKLFIDNTGKDELAEFIVNLDLAVEGLGKNNRGFAEAYRKSMSENIELRRQVDEILQSNQRMNIDGCTYRKAIEQVLLKERGHLSRESEEYLPAVLNGVDLGKDVEQKLASADEYVSLLERLVCEKGAPLPFDNLAIGHEAWRTLCPGHKCGVG
jgi:hypothetical protein